MLGGFAAAPGNDRPQIPTSAAAGRATDDNADIFDTKLHPGATVVHPVDPHTLSESQIKFGIAPKRDPSVEYQPDIILMENGDKAIKSVAGDGMTWTFDANAPQVSDFQEGKIVFATSRAVGRVLGLKRQGDSVSVILGPIQLTDVIRNGSFEMHQDVDLNNMISYVAPDYPPAARRVRADEDQPCRQGTIEINLDTGVGYSIPKWVTDAINIFLSPFTSKRVDAAGTFLRGPSNQLFQHVTQIPEGCATPKGGG
jgi:hypothetical protein